MYLIQKLSTMKRVIFSSALIIFSITNVHAQSNDSSKASLTDTFPFFNPNLVAKKEIFIRPNSTKILPAKNTFSLTPSKVNFDSKSFYGLPLNSPKWYEGLGGMVLSTIFNNNQQVTPNKK